MSKLRVEKGASRIRRAPLKATIDGAVADDLALMCDWSDNEVSYLVNLLLGFAVAQSEEFQKYKAERASRGVSSVDELAVKPTPAKAEPTSAVRT